MARRLLVVVLLGAGCLDRNPMFIDSTGETDGGPPPTTSATEASTGMVIETTMHPTSAATTAIPGTDTETPMETTGATEMTATSTPGTTDPTMPETTMSGPACGDSKVEAFEECDDGNGYDLDDCSNTCTLTFCGDGVVQDTEDCDDGMLSPTSPCLPDCVAATCGDGFVLEGVEQCDDGDQLDDDDCAANCSFPPKLVFVTSGLFSGNLNGLAGADMQCQKAAKTAKLPGDYKAWLSSGSFSPSNRMTHSPGPYLLVDTTTKIADSWDDLTDGTLDHPISQTEKGGIPPQGGICGKPGVYTNTKSDGTTGQPDADCNGWTKPEGVAWCGNASGFVEEWTQACPDSICDGVGSLYCFQQ